MKHIVWDWNGTLLNDRDAVLGATYEVFRGTEADGVTAEQVVAAYTRPIWVTYEALLGRPLREGEWERLDALFHDHYERLFAEALLAVDAQRALTLWEGAGRTQSILSMAGHDHLVLTVEKFGITPFFRRVDGLRGAAGGGKAEHMAVHVAQLGVDPADVLVIGDAADDAVAAAHVGAHAVLYTGGMQRREELELAGVPVLDSLIEALAFAGVS
ncbi:HAD family hydrolase [Actinocorallia longicatena]|uniref:HAD-IA family hydrolase n=1 Tax=Actinocorallia longicatena TaxID=111803 RepID=A0ABP6QN77_9ACTN